MTEQEFQALWTREEASYRAWGYEVVNEVKRLFEEQNQGRSLDLVLKIPACPRVKELDSMLGKAFHRAKGYEDPYTQIEDKVGVRFVVLLTSEIALLERAIESSKLWTHSKDRDFEADRSKRPEHFAYQSMHYVVRARNSFESGSLSIASGVPCEIQIRTLLQHAHCELTRDTIYKRDADTEVSRKVERTVAKSMALIEAVDDYFESVVEQLKAASIPEKAALSILSLTYQQSIGLNVPITKTDVFVVHAFKGMLPEDLDVKLREFLAANPSVPANIKSKFERRVLFRSPAILLAYYMVQTHPEKTKEVWPLTPDDIEPVYTDLGKRY